MRAENSLVITLELPINLAIVFVYSLARGREKHRMIHFGFVLYARIARILFLDSEVLT